MGSFLILTLTVSGVGIVAACSSSSSSSPANCGGDMQAYDGYCLATAAVTYIECTKGLGFDISSQIGGAVGGTFRAVLGLSLNLASEKTEHEDTPVALQIVKNCLTVAQQTSQNATDSATVQDFLQQTNQAIQNWQQSWQQTLVKETPHITLDKSSAAIGETVTVSGKRFWPNETIDIRVSGILVKQVQADNNGAFSTEIIVPQDAPPPDFPTTIEASGETSAKSAEAPFETAG